MKQLTFVIGAGASAELGLPTGVGLKQKIEKSFSAEDVRGVAPQDELIGGAIQWLLHEKRSSDHMKYFVECSHISKSLVLAESIDHYINAHQKNEVTVELSKIAIIKEIWAAERASSLFFEPRKPVTFGKITEAWCIPFFQMLVRGATIEDIQSRLNNLCLIIFNYDRCVEHFLHNAFQGYFRIDSDRAAELVNSIKIYHPYGQAGDLPWKKTDESISFGGYMEPEQIIRASKNIKTFSEANHKTQDFKQMQDSLAGANVLCFIGFAYYDLNMRLLNLLRPVKSKCYMTVRGMSDSDISRAQTYLGNSESIKRPNIKHRDITCAGFFGEYSSEIFNNWMSH